MALLSWPSHSPDLSPIEHMWDMIDTRLSNLLQPPNNLVYLRHRIQEVWDGIPQDTINHLLSSMPHRLTGCIRNRVESTHY